MRRVRIWSRIRCPAGKLYHRPYLQGSTWRSGSVRQLVGLLSQLLSGRRLPNLTEQTVQSITVRNEAQDVPRYDGDGSATLRQLVLK